MYSNDIEKDLPMPQLQIAASYVTDICAIARVSEGSFAGRGNFLRLDVEISFNSKRASPLGLAMFNVVAPGEQVVAQAMLQDCLPGLQKGLNRWKFSIPSLEISSGSYALTLGVFEPGNRRFVLNLRNFSKFTTSGNPGFYPLYAPHAVGISE